MRVDRFPKTRFSTKILRYRPPTDEEDPAEAAKRAEEVEAIRKEVEENFSLVPGKNEEEEKGVDESCVGS